MAFTDEPGSLGTINGYAITRSSDTGLTNNAGNGPHQVTAGATGKLLAVTRLTAESNSANTTAQFFSGEPGSGGVALGEPLRVSTAGDSYGFPPLIVAQTATGAALWVQIVGSGTVGMSVYHARVDA